MNPIYFVEHADSIHEIIGFGGWYYYVQNGIFVEILEKSYLDRLLATSPLHWKTAFYD